MQARRAVRTVALCLAGAAGLWGFATAHPANSAGEPAIAGVQQTTPPSVIHHPLGGAHRVPGNIAEETRGVVNDCRRSERYAAYHDCTCVGKAYGRARSGGQHMSASEARQKTQDSCIDVARASRYEYGLCTDNHTYDHGNYKPFCKCFADAKVRAYAKAPGDDPGARAAAQSAREKCVGLWPKPERASTAGPAAGTQVAARQSTSGVTPHPTSVPASVLNERKLLLADCHDGGPNASLLHDCNCIADRFVKARLAGDDAPLSDIYPRLSRGACPNLTGTTQYVYESCAGYYKGKRTDYVAFCTCVGKETAQNFVRSPIYGKLAYMRIQAMQKCGMVTHGRPLASRAHDGGFARRS